MKIQGRDYARQGILEVPFILPKGIALLFIVKIDHIQLTTFPQNAIIFTKFDAEGIV